MIGCLIAGGLMLFAVGRLIHFRRWHHGWGGCGYRHRGWHGGWHGGHGRRHGWGGPGPDDDWGASLRDDGGPDDWADIRGKRYFIRAVLSHVRATPTQERAIGAAFEEFRDDVKKLGGGERKRSRQEIADALRRPTVRRVVHGRAVRPPRHGDRRGAQGVRGPGGAGARRAGAGAAQAAGRAGRARAALRLVAVSESGGAGGSGRRDDAASCPCACCASTTTAACSSCWPATSRRTA